MARMFINGKERDMTAEEEADHLAFQASIRADEAARVRRKPRAEAIEEVLIAKGLIVKKDVDDAVAAPRAPRP